MINKRSDSFRNPSSQQLVQENKQLKFTNQQSFMKRAQSLRKIDTNQPTFAPEIHELPFQIYPDKTRTQISRQQLIQRLLENRKQKSEYLRVQKLKKQEQYCSQNCTFKPIINAESKKIVQKEGRQGKETFQRLYQQGISRLKSLNDLTNTTQHQKKQNCTFHPIISDNAKAKTDLTPIYNRLYDILSQKRQNMKKLVQQKEQRQYRDKPEVNYKSKQILQKKIDFKKNVLERLFNDMKDKDKKMQKLVQQRLGQLTKECTFQPNINANIQNSFQGNFLERQDKQAVKHRQKIHNLKINKQACFKPQINRLSNLLVQAQRQGETTKQKIQRLHNEPLFQRQIEIAKIEQQIYKECTFQPQINVISKALQGQPHSHKCNCHPLQQNYHFKPTINPKSRILAQKCSKNQNPKQLVDQMRLQLQYKQMKQCTFKPKTLGQAYKSTKNKTSLNNVRGADEFQQRIQKAKQKKRQQQQLKQRLFQLNKRYQQRSHTKVSPFKLTTKQPQLIKLKYQAEEQFQKLHPFKPQFISKLR